MSDEQSRPLIRQAVEAGINFFDTANLYSQGSSEEITGRALRDFARRDEVVIATKVRHPMRPGPNSSGLSRKEIFAAAVAKRRGVSRAQVALAWLRGNPVVVAPLVGASKPLHLEDAVASLGIELADDEVAELEAPYTPCYDFQGVSDDAELARISARLGISPARS